MVTLEQEIQNTFANMIKQNAHYPLSMNAIRAESRRIRDALTMLPSPDSSEQRFLDIGLGLGVAALSLRSKRKGCSIFGVEQPTRGWLRNPDWRRIVVSNGDVRLALCDILKDGLPFAADQIDAVLFMEVIEHLPIYPERLMKDICRVLKPGGHLLLTTPNYANLFNLLAWIRGKEPENFAWYDNPSDDPTYAAHVNEYTTGELRRLLTITGYTVLDVRFGNYIADPLKGAFAPLKKVLMKAFPYLRPTVLILAEKRTSTIEVTAHVSRPLQDRAGLGQDCHAA